MIGEQFITEHVDDEGKKFEVLVQIIGKGVEKGKKKHYVMRYIRIRHRIGVMKNILLKNQQHIT